MNCPNSRPDYQHFLREFSSRMQKQIIHFSSETMRFIQQYAWPGNVHELKNLEERAVIMSSGPNLEIPSGDFTRMMKDILVKDSAPSKARTLAEAERDYILDVLWQVRGVVGGRYGAAARLGLPRTTLISRMRKLGIAAGVGKPAARPGVEDPDADLLQRPIECVSIGRRGLPNASGYRRSLGSSAFVSE
jgi:formate hydrogenlyase transcriptional activator